jgi:O-antigen/teichoic acid export membrane protein
MESSHKEPAGEAFRHRVLSSLAWKYMETFGITLVSFVISIVVARLLGPKVIGTVALLTVFINWSTIFIQSGFNMALIQRSDINQQDFSSVFYINSAISLLLYGMLFLGAPLVAKYYQIPELTGLLRVLALQLLPGGLVSIQSAIIARKFQFREAFFRSIITVILSGSIGVYLAYAGFGAWALVIQSVASVYIGCIVFAIASPWKPSFVFSWGRVKGLLSFGGRILISSMLDSVYQEMYSLAIGKRFQAAALGYYNKGKQFPTQIVIAIDSSIQSVMLPAYSSKQDDKAAVKSMLRRTISTSSFIVFPILAGMAATADPLVRILLSEQWIGSVPFLQMYCIVLLSHPLTIANGQAINALGRSDVTLKINLWKKGVGFAILFASLLGNIYTVAWGMVISSAFFLVFNISPNKKLIDYGVLEQIKDILPYLALSGGMFCIVYLWNFVALSPALKLILQVITGIAVYLGSAKLFQMESLYVVIDIAKHYLSKRKQHGNKA